MNIKCVRKCWWRDNENNSWLGIWHMLRTLDNSSTWLHVCTGWCQYGLRNMCGFSLACICICASPILHTWTVFRTVTDCFLLQDFTGCKWLQAKHYQMNKKWWTELLHMFNTDSQTSVFMHIHTHICTCTCIDMDTPVSCHRRSSEPQALQDLCIGRRSCK